MVENKGGRPRKPENVRRRKAAPHGRGRLKLYAPEIPGFHTRWVTDTGTRINDFTKLDDYDFVKRDEINNEVGETGDGNTELGSKVRVLVGTDESGPVYQYLLKKRIDWHKEDIAEKEEARREKEATLRRGNDQIENQYGSIKNR